MVEQVPPQVVSQTGQSALGYLAPTSNPCANLPSGAATAYSYNASGERMTSTPEMNGAPSASPADFTWNNAASLPEINQVSTSAGVGSAYVYGPLLFGGSAPEEQISTASSGSAAPTVTFMASTPQGVQLTFTTSGTVLNKASYTAYGQQINSNPTPAVTVPFGFDGGYTDSTGLDYFINRYYDPTTAQFISVDPQLAATGEAYAFAGDNPLNATDPTGLSWWGAIVHAVRHVAHAVNHFVHVVGHFVRTHWKAIVTVAAIVAVVVVVSVATAGVGDLALGAAAAAGEGAVEAAGEGAVELASEEAAAAEEEAAAEAAQQAAERKAAQEAARETTQEVQSANSSDASSTSQSTDEGQSCVLQSFTPTTLVKMANGTTEAIKDIKIGDKVLATNPKTGVTIAETVTATNIHNDSDLMDVVVATSQGDQTIHATDRHPFWDKTSNSWTFAENLHPGDSLKTLGGRTATVVRTVQLPGNAFMWDLTVSTDHDFYVSVGAGSQTAVLVHNCGDSNWGNPDTLAKHFGDHGADFGSSSPEEYAQQASDFYQNAANNEIKIDGDGVTRMYDPESNTFGSYNPDGTTRTFFKPTSPNYWSVQPGSAPWG